MGEHKATAGWPLFGGLHPLGGETPITPILVGDEDKARAPAGRLAARGVIAPVMTFPIVPPAQARLLLQPSASHDTSDIDLACAIIGEESQLLGILPR